MAPNNPHAVPPHVVAMLAAMKPSTKILPGDNPNERPVEHSLSKIVEWQDSDRTAPEPVVQCPVCYAEIDVKGLSALNPVEAPSTPPPPHPVHGPTGPTGNPIGIALICSHILCSVCALNIYRSTGPTANRSRKCVLCRGAVVHPMCGHLAMMPVPRRDDAYFMDDMATPYVNGRDNKTPEWCPRCVLGDDGFGFGFVSVHGR